MANHPLVRGTAIDEVKEKWIVTRDVGRDNLLSATPIRARRLVNPTKC
jgi:hypothetical protein